MPNICVVAFADGRTVSRELADWPDYMEIQKAVGGLFATAHDSFELELDGIPGAGTGRQRAVVYCNESGLLKGLPVNTTAIAKALNDELGDDGPLRGDLFLVSGDQDFIAQEFGDEEDF